MNLPRRYKLDQPSARPHAAATPVTGMQPRPFKKRRVAGNALLSSSSSWQKNVTEMQQEQGEGREVIM